LSDVCPTADLNAEWNNTYRCELKSGLIYQIELAQKDGKHYAKLSASAPSVGNVRISRTEADSELKKKESKILAAETAQKFTEAHDGWAYELPGYAAEKLCKPLTDLLEDIPAEKVPDEITASHILISYAGAERSEATRTKDDAKKLAEQVLEESRQPDADFAALAKKYSDDPSGKDGGSLGKFKKGVMAPPFEEAAYKLKVGEISSVVETPFGFHIIKRTE